MKQNEITSIAIYRQITILRNILKNIQQISWDVTQFNKRFPLEQASEENFIEILQEYLNFIRLAQKSVNHVSLELLAAEQIINNHKKMKQDENKE